MRQEPRLGGRQPREELGAEVVGHEPVVAGEGRAALASERPAWSDSAARYRPAGQPSVRSVSSATSAASSSTPAAAAAAPASPLVQTELGRADLVHRPCARQRASGSAGSSRLATAICDPAGHVLEQRGEHVEAGRLSTRWRSSSTSTSGLPQRGQRVAERGTRFDQIDPPGPDSASNTSGASGSTRCSAAAM